MTNNNIHQNFKNEREMKTPVQELLKLESDLTRMFDSDQRVAMALLEHIRNNKKEMLEKEKSFLIKTHGNKKVYDSQIDPTIVTGEEWYNKTFSTKER